jgi:ubiquinone/menaquinone biosynthesis C-methylase UbiE
MGEEEEWTTDDWVRKLKQQADDSRPYRQRLYARVGLVRAERVLDVGCGTGAVTLDIAESTRGQVVGVDIDEAKLVEARRLLEVVPNLEFQVADVQDLPFPDGSFDLVTLNIVLVYVPDKQRALAEMARVLRPGGHVLATMEPDYAGWIQYPPGDFVELFFEQLRQMGADLETGRKLKYLFTRAGLRTEVGIDAEDEFIFLRDDERKLARFESEVWFYDKLLSMNGWSEEARRAHIAEERERIEAGLSFSFLPGFYAIGRKE